MNAHPRKTWRSLLSSHVPNYITWLEQRQILPSYFDQLATNLKNFLMDSLQNEGDWEDFVAQLDVVLERCDEAIYDKPIVALAYAHVHFLERYRRFWAVLDNLLKAGVLPMKRGGVNVLDIGTGPGPALYAIGDYYHALQLYAEEGGFTELLMPVAALHAVEQSYPMRQFIHLFSEYCHRPGPFGGPYGDFTGFSTQSERDNKKRAWLRAKMDPDDESYWDMDTPRWEEFYRYQLIIFSNFLTRMSDVERFHQELRGIFHDMHPGGVVIVVGGTGNHYPAIYDGLVQIAHSERVRPILDVPLSLPISYTDRLAQRIKQHYDLVWANVTRIIPSIRTAHLASARDLWDPRVPYKGPLAFSLRVFRKGR